MNTLIHSARIALTALAVSLGSVLQAQVIISDSFDGGGDGVPIDGRTPDTDLPGAMWVKATAVDPFRTTLTDGYGNPVPGTFGTFQAGSGISLASSGSYVKPLQFTISADLSPKDIVGTADQFRGLALGFYSAVGSGQQFSQNLFTGLVFDAAGNLSVVSDPNPTGFQGGGSTVSPSIPFAGAFDPFTFHTLSYDVNTFTSRISNVRLSGSTADYSAFSTYELFSDAATTYAGMYTSSALAQGLGALDNFSVTTVPEPTAMALTVTTSIGLLGLRRRRSAS